MVVSSEQSKTNSATTVNSLYSKKASNGQSFYQSNSLFIQPKLTIGASDDVYKKEPDDISDKVMRMQAPGIFNFSTTSNIVSRKCAACEQKEKLQRKEIHDDNAASTAPSIVHDVLNSSDGRSLDTETLSFMEPRFNYNFSQVKIHDNELAAKTASAVNALAYAAGNNIVFNSGQYNTGSDTGKRLLAHELTHVVQQGSTSSNDGISKKPDPYIARFSDTGHHVIEEAALEGAGFNEKQRAGIESGNKKRDYSQVGTVLNAALLCQSQDFGGYNRRSISITLYLM